jgi:hypothetical protein
VEPRKCTVPSQVAGTAAVIREEPVNPRTDGLILLILHLGLVDAINVILAQT